MADIEPLDSEERTHRLFSAMEVTRILLVCQPTSRDDPAMVSAEGMGQLMGLFMDEARAVLPVGKPMFNPRNDD